LFTLPERGKNGFRPHLGGPLRRNTNVVILRRQEQPVGVFKTAAFDPVDPDDETGAEGFDCLRRRTDEVGDRQTARLDHLVAQPAHTPSVLDPVRQREPQILVQIGSNLVGVEHDGLEHGRESSRKRRLAGAGQSHDENFLWLDANEGWFGQGGGVRHSRSS
jgi:hypothetical protein